MEGERRETQSAALVLRFLCERQRTGNVSTRGILRVRTRGNHDKTPRKAAERAQQATRASHHVMIRTLPLVNKFAGFFQGDVVLLQATKVVQDHVEKDCSYLSEALKIDSLGAVSLSLMPT